MSIRFKVILPYLLLTLLVAVTGVYVVTRLVANTWTERLTNQLLEAGRVVSDGFARQDAKNVEVARVVAYTRGVAEATRAEDTAALATLVRPVAAGLAAESLILVDLQGDELLQVLVSPDGTLGDVTTPTAIGTQPFVLEILQSGDPQHPPGRGLAFNSSDGRYYIYTALPVTLDSQVVGAVIIGTSLNTTLPYLKSTALADIAIYGPGGQIVATTLPGDMRSLEIAASDVALLIGSDNIVQGQNTQVEGREYSLARGPLRIGDDTIGVYAIVLPSDFVIQPSSASRNTYLLLFLAAMAGVVVIGVLIARLIIRPLSSLVHTSQEIAKGDLNQRSGIKSSDEIGTLASTFDEMTSRLQERTAELEHTYHTLEQMDRTKTSFIDVSAHELRSPLTSVKGYAQMMEIKAKDNPEMEALTNGLIDGVDRMTEIVNNMLDVTRIDSNMLQIIPDQVQIGSVLMRVQKTFDKGLKERDITLETVGLGGLPVIQADPDLIYKVFYHLVMNAIKYTPDGGSIAVSGQELRANAQPPEIEIVIADTGIGVDPEYHEAIFEKFFQTGEVLFHSSGKTKFKGGGPGLGLAIARGIINAHNGRIWVESAGHDENNYPGSRFFVRLPIGRAKI
ncbi:MAG: HAMP domain-containing protein [Anaerolineales bacterium]|nr:HAMP domain-containing protein [Anaerolineales bacterium]